MRNSFLTEFHLGKNERGLLLAQIGRVNGKAIAGRDRRQSLVTLQKKGLIEMDEPYGQAIFYKLTGAGEKCREELLNA